AHAVAGAAVAADLPVDVADRAELKLLGHELRRTPIEMHVDAVLVLGRLVLEIVGEAEHAREFVPGLRIEIGIAAPGVDRAVPDAEIREAGRVVGPDRYVAGDVSHVVVDARVPAQRRYWDHVSETPHRVADAVGARERDRSQWSCQGASQRPRERRA